MLDDGDSAENSGRVSNSLDFYLFLLFTWNLEDIIYYIDYLQSYSIRFFWIAGVETNTSPSKGSDIVHGETSRLGT